jgi:hypothetical protein
MKIKNIISVNSEFYRVYFLFEMTGARALSSLYIGLLIETRDLYR